MKTEKDVVIPESGKSTYTDDEKKIMEKNDLGYTELVSAMDARTSGGKVAFNVCKNYQEFEVPRWQCP